MKMIFSDFRNSDTFVKFSRQIKSFLFLLYIRIYFAYLVTAVKITLNDKTNSTVFIHVINVLSLV